MTYYSLERTIYRISISKYAEHFVLKGGIFLYAIYDRNYERATTDIDLLARRISNSRYKDFYDICVLTDKYMFQYDDIKNAVTETFQNRGTPLSMNTAAFGEEFVLDPLHRTRWISFLKKKKALVQMSLEDAISGVKVFAEPVLNTDSGSKSRWNPESRM